MITTVMRTTTVMRQLSLKLQDIGAPDCMEEVADITADYVQKFVPRRTGFLRGSIQVRATWQQSEIWWDAPYAEYQYAGHVWGPNKPVFNSNGEHIGWEMGKGKRKDTGRMMGENTGTYTMKYGPNKGKTFTIEGYHTEGTTHHWIRVARKGSGYRQMRANITRAIKKRWENS